MEAFFIVSLFGCNAGDLVAKAGPEGEEVIEQRPRGGALVLPHTDHLTGL